MQRSFKGDGRIKLFQYYQQIPSLTLETMTFILLEQNRLFFPYVRSTAAGRSGITVPQWLPENRFS